MKPVKLIKNLENLDKSTWDVVRFGDVVREVKDVSRDPVSEGIERIIGLEHLNPLDIHIRTWGDTTNGTTFTKRFSKGQVLFGRRRAYQKKAVLADFDGICSGDIIVMEAIKERLDSGLLPFLVHGDGFYNWAVSTSAGSLSPRTKFKSLAEYEFRLPPMDVQKKLAELLWAVDEAEEKYLESKDRTASLRKAIFDELTSKKSYLKCLGDCLLLSKTKSVPPHNEERYIGLEHVDSGVFSTDKFVISKNVASVCNVFKKGHLLYSKLRPNLDKAVIATFDGVCTTELLVYGAKKDISLEYILHHLHSDKFVAYAFSKGFGTKMPRISHKILSDFKIYAPSHKEQLSILNKLTKLRETEMSLSKSFHSTRKLRDNLINSIF